MRNSYMVEYQTNLDQNTSRKDDKITEVSQEIETQNSSIKELKDQKSKQKSCLNTFFKQKVNHYRLRVTIRAWQYFTKVQKRKNRVAAFTRNTLFRRKQKLVFESWRGVSHQWFKERLDRSKDGFRKELEDKMLTSWS